MRVTASLLHTLGEQCSPGSHDLSRTYIYIYIKCVYVHTRVYLFPRFSDFPTMPIDARIQDIAMFVISSERTKMKKYRKKKIEIDEEERGTC